MKSTDNEKLVVGMRSVLKGISNGEVESVVIARDTDTFIRNKVINACTLYQVPYTMEGTKEELGLLAKKQVPTAIIGHIK